MKRLQKGKKYLERPLYLNANLLLSECLKEIQKPHWKTRIKTDNILSLLIEKGFVLICSTFTKAEVLQKLRLEKHVPLEKGRYIFEKVIADYRIYLLVDLQVQCTAEFFDLFSKYKLSFTDYLHIRICKSYDMPMCTHDKKLILYCKHEEKKKLYAKVFKPEHLLKNSIRY